MTKINNISIIVAMGLNGEIGANNEMLWNIKEEMKLFRETTTGNTIIMGRKTAESLPKGYLPNRRNIVISTGENTMLKPLSDCVEETNSIQKAIELCSVDEKIFIIGGASIYEQMFHLADTLIISEIQNFYDNADKFFPTKRFDLEYNLISEQIYDTEPKFIRKIYTRKIK